MSTTRLPKTVEPYRLASQGELLSGSLPLAHFSRLVDAIGDQVNECQVELVFGIDMQRQHYIEGRLRADVDMRCQRCLQPLPVSLDSSFLLGLVTTDELAARLPGRYEPVFVEDEQLDLLPVVEDELLLTLPQVVYHDESDCPVRQEDLKSGDADAVSEETKPNPFSVLGSLKDKH
ncbi:YceD family protein [Larsenimonas rhizosphaerae]|uniref:Large ribosomal RNA subunit accumulation protein YceD n=1 Tax=Larsenimonas rhizosphaerae TaxID=2944682 RepID=A0AA42CU34_9GAMM|nr:YceD family protein [Larsenimonas rhizosphaerae]MCM2130966.1 YceD family protein [Larsenimonas rhizosphaerae]MCX2523671.1 YceD family protein [Larsenimonas rhizosphaerae]